jgi:hypothetical protein
VKLAEGGLGGPRKEDVHWLDWHQLKVSLLLPFNMSVVKESSGLLVSNYFII